MCHLSPPFLSQAFSSLVLMLLPVHAQLTRLAARAMQELVEAHVSELIQVSERGGWRVS